MSSLVEWFVPPALRGDPVAYRQTRFVVAVCLAVFVVEPCFSLWHFVVTHNLATGFGTLAVATMGLVIALLMRAGLPVTRAVHVLSAVIYVGMFGICLARGGFIVTAIVPNILFPLVWVLLEQRRAALIWAALGLIELTAIAILARLNLFGLVPDTALAFPQMAGYLGAATALALLYDSARRSTEREKAAMRRRMAEAQQLETVGHLAAGVAHDFNNLMTVVSASTEAIEEALPAGDPLRVETEAIYEALARAALITKQLLGFARPGREAATAFDATAQVSGLKELLHRLIPAPLELAMRLPATPCYVRADPEAVSHAIVNLVANARDAMPDGGVVTVEVRREQLTLPDPLAAGSYVAIVVRDTGTGMPEAVLAHIFDPFFTTKGKSSGTGLGLSSAHGTARAASGDLRVSTELGKGSEFVLLLPELAAEDVRTSDRLRPIADHAAAVVAAAAQTIPAPVPLSVTPPRPEVERGVTVLVVDDQAVLLRSTRRLLANQGFRVVEAGSGAAALDYLAGAAHEHIDVLLTDVQMPGMSGVMLSAQFRAVRPGVPVVYMSGYSDEPAVTDEVARHQARFVRKPFDRAQIVGELVRAVGRDP